MNIQDNSTARCCICEQEFIKRKMINNKCQLCHRNFPNANSKEEAQEQVKKEQNAYNAGSFEARVEKQVNEMLVEWGLLNICACGNPFHKKSPAQKYCSADCSAKETKNE